MNIWGQKIEGKCFPNRGIGQCKVLWLSRFGMVRKKGDWKKVLVSERKGEKRPRILMYFEDRGNNSGSGLNNWKAEVITR